MKRQQCHQCGRTLAVFVNETTCEECHNRVAENFERFAESLTEDVLAQLYPTYAAKRKAGVRG